MKKFFLLSLIIPAIALVAFTTKSTESTKNISKIEVSASTINNVSVCKITKNGNMTVTNWSFKGKYDTEKNKITIYDKDGNYITSGTPERNTYTSGKKANFTHCLGVYFFNL